MVLFFNLIVGYIINFIFSFVIHNLMGKSTGTFSSRYKTAKIDFLQLLLFTLLSPDYIFAHLYKMRHDNKVTGNLEEYKIKRKNYIKQMNTLNLILSIVIAVVVGICFKEVRACLRTNLDFFSFFIGFVIFRIISRSIEIIIAFGTDVTSDSSKSKSSSLSKNERIKLAIKSYFDIIVMYFPVYFLFQSCVKKCCCFSYYCCCLESQGFCESVLKSFGVSTLSNAGFKDYVFVDTFIILQVLTTITLVSLSIAIYVSMNDKEVQKENIEKNIDKKDIDNNNSGLKKEVKYERIRKIKRTYK